MDALFDLWPTTRWNWTPGCPPVSPCSWRRPSRACRPPQKLISPTFFAPRPIGFSAARTQSSGGCVRSGDCRSSVPVPSCSPMWTILKNERKHLDQYHISSISIKHHIDIEVNNCIIYIMHLGMYCLEIEMLRTYDLICHLPYTIGFIQELDTANMNNALCTIGSMLSAASL